MTGFSLLFPLNLPGKVVERIVALVNNEVITLSELEETGRLLFEQIRATSLPSEWEEKLKKARQEVLDHLVESKLLDQEIRKRKIEVPDRDVDSFIVDLLKTNKMTENDLKKALAKEGMTLTAYRQKVHDEIGKMRLVSREIKAKIVIEEEALRKHYKENLEKYSDPLEVKVQQIFFPVPPGASEQESETIRKEGLSILERSRRGEDFGQLARKYSRGPEAKDGGVLGFFKPNEMRPELEKVAFGMKPGEVSDLVRTPEGFHILRVMERKGGEPRPFAEVQYRIREEMIQAESERRFREWMKELKSKAYIEIRL